MMLNKTNLDNGIHTLLQEEKETSGGALKARDIQGIQEIPSEESWQYNTDRFIKHKEQTVFSLSAKMVLYTR